MTRATRPLVKIVAFLDTLIPRAGTPEKESPPDALNDTDNFCCLLPLWAKRRTSFAHVLIGNDILTKGA